MQPHFYLLKANLPQKGQQQLLSKVFVSSLKQIQQALPFQHPVDVVFQVNPQTTIPEIGIGGYTPNAYTVFISLDPEHKDFLSSVKLELPRTLAHELHHAVRWSNPGYGETLSEALVTEGLAANFEIEVFGGKPNMWDVAVRGKKLQTLLTRARREWNTPYNHSDWFFGSTKRNIPRWAGYALGFSVVRQAIKKNPQWLASNLAHIEAKQIAP